MGRHSDGKQNYSLSTGSIFAIVVVIVLIVVAGVWWWLQRSPEPDTAAEPARECTLVPVAATDESLGELLVANWSSNDECIDVELVDSLDDAALLVAPDSPLTEETLADREVAGDPVAVASVPVGVSGTVEAGSDVDPAEVSYPTEEQPEASALVASALGAEGELGESPEATWSATAENQLAEGATFTPIDELVYFAHPLRATEGISGQQADAAATLASTAAEDYDGPASSPEVSEEVWAAAGIGEAPQSPPPAEGAPAPIEAAPNTLFLLDTSVGMEPYAESAAAAVGAAAMALTEGGNLAGLWNYSSPLTPGVTEGWRRNITYTDAGDDIDWAAQRFGSGGQPQTRSAVLAALANANDQAASTGEATRVVLITSGTSADLNDEAFREALAGVDAAGVELSVLHVGSGAVDAVLQEAANEFVAVAEADDLGSAVSTAAGA